MKRAKVTPPPDLGKVIAHQDTAEHHTKCPICGHMVDEWDLAEVMAHLEPGHKPPLKN